MKIQTNRKMRAPHSQLRSRNRRRMLVIMLLVACYFALANYKMTNINIQSERMLIIVGVMIMYYAISMVASQSRMERKLYKIQDASAQKVVTYENGSRATMMVEKTVQDSENAYLDGYMYGTIHENDTVYLYQGIDEVYQGTIKQIVKGGIRVQESIDSKVSLTIAFEHDFQILPYATVSSVIPFQYVDADTPIENPRLLSCMTSWPFLHGNDAFSSTLAYQLSHARFLVSAVRQKEGMKWYDRVYEYFFGYDGNYGFLMVGREGEKNTALAVYTDWQAYNQNQISNKVNQNCEAIVLTFQEVLPILKVNQSPLIINPFGPGVLELQYPFIQALLDSKGYQKDFGTAKEENV